MEAILRDERICSSTTTDEVCHTIIKPSTVPLGWVETVQPKSMSWGTMYVTAYKNLSTGERFPHPPAGTAALSDVLCVVAALSAVAVPFMPKLTFTPGKSSRKLCHHSAVHNNKSGGHQPIVTQVTKRPRMLKWQDLYIYALPVGLRAPGNRVKHVDAERVSI